MKYPKLTLWTWDGTRQRYMIPSSRSKRFKANIVKYTDTIGYGMQMEITTRTNLDEFVGGLVHNVPDHENMSPRDLTGFWWCLQLFKIKDSDEKINRYMLVDLTFGKSNNFKYIESRRAKTATQSPFARALTNANPDKLGLFVDGQAITPNVNYLRFYRDSKTNLLYQGSDNTDGLKREDLINFFIRSGERHSPRMQREPSFGTSQDNVFDWYLEPVPEFRTGQNFDTMLDEYELEEIVDQQEALPYTAVRQWNYRAYWVQKANGQPGDYILMEDKTKVDVFTQYIAEDNTIERSSYRGVDPQEIFGLPMFIDGFPDRSTLKPPRIGGVKFVQQDSDIEQYEDFTSMLQSQLALSRDKNYKVNRVLDVNQRVSVNYRSYIVTEVDYINEISVIGKVTGII
ncbi:hypothetical protein AXI71_gp42 [Lactococcus phage GE1]|uniref:Uncharacterized protein n=1 Tax=Lactococcus phage GE1 TaxID=1698369 RepID=A0A0N7E0Q2_9CAUD|nr:hypothetical protein AXI71_gp42 [Lactococcus phage GE1]ALA06996.1 hypothetical protein [Lactococcus phage GE1]